jgi:hypothetical protein
MNPEVQLLHGVNMYKYLNCYSRPGGLGPGLLQPSHILDVTRQEHPPFFEPMTGSLGNHLIHRQPATGFRL